MGDIAAVMDLAPVYEYLLQGSVTDKMTETLLHRLEGLTDYREGGREGQIVRMAFAMSGGTAGTGTRASC